MSVNLSVKQLQSETIVEDVREALEASGLPPSSLVLEITETVMMADTDLAVRRLHELKSLGVLLAMDDFGTGYSSLSYLSRYPVDILKMDRSFLASEHENSGLAAAIIALGRQPQAQRRRRRASSFPSRSPSLRDLGCELGQGFLFAKPMNDEALIEYLVDGQEPADALGKQRLMQHSHEALDRPGGFSRVNLLAPLRHRDFRLLWAGMTISLIGDGIFLVAMAWQAYELWNAPAALSILGIGMTVPTIAFLLPAGVFSDRLDRRLIMLSADVGRARGGRGPRGSLARRCLDVLAARRSGGALRSRHRLLHSRVRRDRP